MNNQYFGRNSNNHADYVTDHNRGVENGSGTELAGLYGYFLSDDSDSIPMPDSNRVPSNTIYYDTETIDNQAGNYSNVSENTESHHPIDITQGPIESVPIIENYMSPVSTPVVSGGCYLTAANTEIDKTQPEMVSALVPDELHSSISMNSKSELSADQLKSPGVEISTGESELTCSKYSLHALPLGAAEGAEEEKAQAEKTMMNSSKVIKSFVSNNSNLVSNSHDASRNKKRDPVVKGTNYRAPAQSGTPLSVAGVTSSVLAATETGAHLTKKYVGNIAQEAVSTIAPVATDAIESVSKDSAIRDTVDNIKNAVATVADVLHESFLFSIDRTKTFTDHYVIANTIMTDDPEYQHYLHQQRDHLKQRKRKETICNAEKTESRNREIKVGDKVLPLDQAWRLKCYLASLSWYQKHLIIETKEISEILIEASYDYGLLEDPIDIDSSEVPNTAIDGGYVHVDDSDGVENGSRAPNENGEVSAEQLAYMNFYLDKVDHPDDSNDTASEGEVEGDIMVRSGSTGNNDILQSAVKGNQTAQQELLKWFLPPPFACSNECSECHVSFSMRAFRHHCRHCGQSFCSKHAAKYHRIHKFGFATGTVRVCARCYDIIEREEYRDRSLWRVLRLKAYYKRELIPYFERRVDRTVDKVVRVASGTLHLIRSTVSLNYAARIIIETVDIMRRYGLSGLAGVLMRQDFVEAVETLKKISGIDRMFALSLHELTACIYYKIAIERGLRGCNPTAEAIDHDDYAFQVYSNEKDQEGNPMSSQLPGPLTVNPIPVRSSPLGETNDGIYEVEDGELESMIEFAPMALEFAYLPSPVDCERLAHAVGYDTLFFHNELQHSSSNALNEAERPAYVLLASSTDESAHTANKEKIAILAVRGTQTVQDIVTDIRAEPVSFPPDDEEILTYVYNDDTVTNNAWNSGILDKIEADSDVNSGSAGSGEEDSLNLLQEYILSLKHSHKTSKVLSAESEAVKDQTGGYRDWVCYDADAGNPNKSDNADMNAEGYIAPYSSYACGGMVRATIWLLKEVGSSLISLYKSGYNIKLVGHSLGGGVASILTYLLSRILPIVDRSPILSGIGTGHRIRPGALQCITYGCPSCLEEKLSLSLRPYVTTVVLHDDVISRVTPNSIRSLMKELMIFRSSIFHHIQQDWEDVIVRASSLWSPQYRDHRISSNTSGPASAFTNTSNSSSDTGDAADPFPQFNSHILESHVSSTNKNTSSILHNMVNVEEEVLLDLYLPGDVVHIYSIHGQYKIKHVPITFNSLRSILVQGNMFRDHRAGTMYEALLEVKAVRKCTKMPPAWVPYNASQACQCCHSRFTWHTTFRGDAQQYKERYNCRCCGGLVCGPCSEHKENSVALSSIGLILPNNRICDRCFYSGKMH